MSNHYMGRARFSWGAVFCSLLFFGSASAAIAQSTAVDRIEYFVGDDPGFGSGVEVVLAGEEPFVSVAVPTEAIGPGVHRVHFRARNADGEWGLTSSMAVRVRESEELTPAPPVTVAFFIESDPGLGAGQQVAVGSEEPGVSVEVAEVADLPPGLHRLHFRTADQLGRWGLTSSIPVTVSAPDDGFPIGGFDYRITESDGSVRDEGTGGEISGERPTLSSVIAPSVPLVYLEQHRLTLFARDIAGFLSEESPEAPFVVMAPDQEWVQSYFSEEEIESGVASFRRDPDGDSSRTAQEYLALTDPRDAGSASRPIFSDEDGFLHLHYVQRSGGTGTPGIDYVVAGMSVIADASLEGPPEWENGPDAVTFVEATPAEGGMGVELVTVRQNQPIGESESGFLRVRFESAPP